MVKKRTGWRGLVTRGRLVGAGVVTGALVLAGGGIAWASTAGAGGGYRLATATAGSVEETLTLSGSLASATRRDRAFAASGTVTAVNVKVGDRVAAGDVLATIDPSDLEDAVSDAESALADAEQALADDLDSQTAAATSSSSGSSSSGSGSGSGSSGAGSGSGGGSGDPAVTAALEGVAGAQQNLLTLVDAASAALVASQEQRASAAAVCRPFLDATLESGDAEGGGDDSDGSGEGVPGSGTQPQSTDDAAGAATPLTLEAVQQLLADCQQAITGAGDTQTVVSSAQDAVQAAMSDLDTAVTALREAVEASGSSGAEAPGSGSGSGASGSSALAGPGGSSTAAASAADIVADRAEIALASANLALAQHELTAASLTTPVEGTVAYVGVAVGDGVSADSTTQVVTVIGDDGYTMAATVGLARIAQVAVGQTGAAVVTSSGASYAATVSAVGLVNVSTSSTPAYEVEIAIDPAGAALLNGAAVEATIDIAAAHDVLTIPLSALHVDGTGSTVQRLVDGVLTSVPVEVGAVGSERVEIVSGLAEGDEIVLADLSADISSENASTTSGFGGRGGTLTFSGSGGDAGFSGGPPGFAG
jgi:HlyD family secretion protein